MVCVYCSHPTNVVNSRVQKRLGGVWRRRACNSCGAIYTTFEVVDLSSTLRVHKSNGDFMPFYRDKLFLSIAEALGHRQDAVEAAGALCATIITKLLKTSPGASTTAADIARIAADTLEQFDAAGLAYYRAYHRNTGLQHTSTI